MIRRFALPALLGLATVAPAALAAPGGALGTLPIGSYLCEMPGSAGGPVGIAVPEADFAVTNASSYRTAQGSGTYLLTGDRLVMTSGPLRGTKFNRPSTGLLRRLESDGSKGRLRCIYRVTNNR